MYNISQDTALTLHDYNIEILAEEAEYNLFHNSCSENHCLRHIYTVNEKPGATRLRTPRHDFTLPFVKYNFNKKNFMSEPCTIIFRMYSGLSYGFTMF